MRTLTRRARTLAAPIVAGALMATGIVSASAADDFPVTLDTGHIDAFTPVWENDQLVLDLEEDVTGSQVHHAPGDVLLKVKPEAALTLPDPLPASLSFLQPGATVYYLPQTQDPNLIWPGWTTQRLPAGVFADPVHLQVTDVDGPGDVFVWQTGSFGASISVLDGGGFQFPGTISTNVNVHAHLNWAFTEPGRYQMTAQASAGLIAGGTATSEPVVYTFDVGDFEAPQEPVTTTLSIAGMDDHYHPGDVVTLNAVQDPVTDLDHYHWFTKAPGSDEWVVAPGVSGAEYNFTAAEDADGTQVIVRLYDEDHNQVAESAPVTVHVEDHGEEPGEPVETTLTITGVADHYHPGDVVTLNAAQDPVTDLDHYHWYTKAPGSEDWVIAPDAAGSSYSFTATEARDGYQIKVQLFDHDHVMVAESTPVTLHVEDHGQDPGEPGEPGDAAQRIIATLPADEGALVVSVDPADNTVHMSDFELGTAGDRWTSSGQLRPVTVTDTRSAAPGWTASGQVGDFTTAGEDAQTLAGKHLGWVPLVAAQPDGGGVVPGESVAPGLESGDGLAAVSPLAVAPAGAGFGTSTLGADLLIEAPTTLVPGTYEATITFTAI